MAKLKEKSEEERLKHIFDMYCKVCGILIATCGITTIVLAVISMFIGHIPEWFIVIVGVLYIACLVSHTLMISAKTKYFNEIWKT